MDDILENILYIRVSTLLKSEKPFAIDLGCKLRDQLLALDIHTWEVDDYISWNSKVDDFRDNLQALIDFLGLVHISVAKCRINTPENELHIDG